MTQSLDKLPKDVKGLPAAAQVLWVETYNHDFGWRGQEAHAEKAAWRAIRADYAESDAGWKAK